MKSLIIAMIAGLIPAPEVNCDKLRTNDYMAMACNIYHEGRDQSIEGQKAIAAVVMNRVRSKHYPDNVPEVIWQYKQFSWTHDGKSDYTYENSAWSQAKEIAALYVPKRSREDFCYETDQATLKMRQYVKEEYGFKMDDSYIPCEPHDNLKSVKAYVANLIDNTDGSTHYHAKYVQPFWADGMNVVATIGDHVFYTPY